MECLVGLLVILGLVVVAAVFAGLVKEAREPKAEVKSVADPREAVRLVQKNRPLGQYIGSCLRASKADTADALQAALPSSQASQAVAELVAAIESLQAAIDYALHPSLTQTEAALLAGSYQKDTENTIAYVERLVDQAALDAALTVEDIRKLTERYRGETERLWHLVWKGSVKRADKLVAFWQDVVAEMEETVQALPVGGPHG